MLSLPPYSPGLDPIGPGWSEALENAPAAVIEEITAAGVRGWFAHRGDPTSPH